MTNHRRRLRPSERARQDQALTAGRELGATDPRTVVVSVEIIDDGVQCCWCDCPDPDLDPASPHRLPGYVCTNVCPEHAQFVIIQSHGAPTEERLQVCPRHSVAVMAMVERTAAAASIPVEPHPFDVLDVDA